MGWSFASDSIDLIRKEDYTNYTVTKDITLYAVWTTTLTLNANGGSFKSGETITDTVFLGTTVNLDTYETPKKTGYVFGGWAENDFSTNTVASPYTVDAYNASSMPSGLRTSEMQRSRFPRRRCPIQVPRRSLP